MSGNIAVIYAGDLAPVAYAFAEAARHLAARARVLQVDGHGVIGNDVYPEPSLRDLEWADGIGFGTPVGESAPAPALMRFIESTEPLWRSGRLHDKAVTVFTDEPEHFAPDSVLHPIYNALYHWGAVIIGPRVFELALDAKPADLGFNDSPALSAARLRTAQYRARRLARLTGVLADERHRREQLAL